VGEVGNQRGKGGCSKIGQPERIVRRFGFVEGAREVTPAHAAASGHCAWESAAAAL
jgi:hypothetical protein